MNYTESELNGEFQRLLSQPYQRQQARSALHLHRCRNCDLPLTCCCQDRRGQDRRTGEPRAFYCISCEAFMESPGAKDNPEDIT